MTDGAERDYCGEALASVGLEHEAAREQEVEIKRLASMSPLEYYRARKTTAKRLKIGVGELDKVVKKLRADATSGTSALPHWNVEPWATEVSTPKLLADIEKLFRRYIVLPEGAGVALALWTLHAWTVDAGDISPFLVLVSPTKRCGKTNTLILLYYLTPRSELASNITPSALFRYVEDVRPTLLIDEADSFLKGNEEMRGILDSGHTKTAAHVVRNVELNGEHKPRRFSTWAPKAIATIRALADTLEDRAVVLMLQRKPKTAKVERLRRRDSQELDTLRRKAARWAANNFDKLTDPDPKIPEALNDRAADNWRPLLAIADLAGEDWPTRARDAACLLSGEGHDVASVNVELLADIRKAFGKSDIMAPADLVAALVADPERPWSDWKHGRPISQKQLANLLRPFVIISETVHRHGQPDAKGYKRARFEDAWAAYCPGGQNGVSPPIQHSEVSNRPSADGMRTSGDFPVRPKSNPDGPESATLFYSDAGLDGWTDRKTANGGKGEFDQRASLAGDGHIPVRHTSARADNLSDVCVLLRRQPTAPTGPPNWPQYCDYCQRGPGINNPVEPWDWNGREVSLHPRCQAPWADRERAAGSRFRVIADCPSKTVCLHCLQADGNVKRIKDRHAPGSQSETLHEGCAAQWFGD